MTVVPIGMTSEYTMIFGIEIDEIVCFWKGHMIIMLCQDMTLGTVCLEGRACTHAIWHGDDLHSMFVP